MSFLRICIAYLYRISSLNISIAYLHCVSLLRILMAYPAESLRTTATTQHKDPRNNRSKTTRSRRTDEGGDEAQSPPYQSRPKVSQRENNSPPPQGVPRRGLFSHRFSLPFLTQLKSPKEPQDDPPWPPKSGQDRPKMRLETICFRKR